MKAFLLFVFSIVATATRFDMIEASSSGSDPTSQTLPPQLSLPVVLHYVAEEDDGDTYVSYHNTIQMLQKLQDHEVKDRLVLFTAGTSDEHRVTLSRHATTMVPVDRLNIETSDDITMPATNLQSFGLTLFERVIYMGSDPSLLDGTTDLQCLESSCDGPVCSNGKVFNSNSGIMVLEPHADVLDALKGMNEFGDVLLPEQAFFNEIFDQNAGWSMLPEDCFGEASVDGPPALEDRLARIKTEDENVTIERLALSDSDSAVGAEVETETSSGSVTGVVTVVVGALLVLGAAIGGFITVRKRPVSSHVLLVNELEDEDEDPRELSASHFQVPIGDDEEVPSLDVSNGDMN